MSILIRNARVLTMGASTAARRGADLKQLHAIDGADVLISGEHIEAVGKSLDAPESPDRRVIDAGGRVLMPAFVDCHTHACWAGDRLDEWDQKRAGATYLEILEKGGGIMSTVRAVRRATEEELTITLARRLWHMLREGTTTVEVKSGYGLDLENELKMLRAIRAAPAHWPGTVDRTALLGHAMDPERRHFVQRTVDEALPAVRDAFGELTIDAYCEKGAWSVEDCVELFEPAIAAGHPIRIHADQFNSLGMVEWAADLGPAAVRSVDHLEASSAATLKRLAKSDVFGVALPCSGFHTDGRYMDARTFIDAGGALAIATNCNPGSSPTHSMPLAIALAVRFCGLTPAEAIAAATVNPAALLGFDDRGVITPGQRADLVLLRHRDERLLAYEFGGDPTDVVVCAGEIVKNSAAT